MSDADSGINPGAIGSNQSKMGTEQLDSDRMDRMRFEMLKRETEELNGNMSDACIKFGTLAERMEALAKSVKDHARSAERYMFQPFIEAMTGREPLRFRIMGSRDESAVFLLVGMDSTGFWFREDRPDAKDFHVSVLERPDVAGRIVPVVRR